MTGKEEWVVVRYLSGAELGLGLLDDDVCCWREKNSVSGSFLAGRLGILLKNITL
jgi:hypothetical protein